MNASPNSLERFVHVLKNNAPPSAGAAVLLRQAIQDAVSRPGHLTRAALVLDAAASWRMPRARAEQLACAVEYWHAASLMLDDLPCMDDAKERRGAPCMHQTFGESTAILASLALINRGFALVNTAFSGRPEPLRRQASRLVERVLGPCGLVGGQAHDLGFATSEKQPREAGRIAWLKTGTLLWLCVALPALWSRTRSLDRQDLRRLCVYWGLAYQGMDDLRDVLSSSAASGKTSGRDAALRRPNLALAFGVPGARRRVQRLLKLADHTVESLIARDSRHAHLRRWHERVFVARELALCAA